MNEQDLTTKSQRRLESKKRKAAAFLRLVKESEADTACMSNKGTSESSMEPGNKKPRLDVTHDENIDNSEKQNKTEEEIQEAKRILKERQKMSMQRPKLFLTMNELTRDFPGLPDEGMKQQPPLYMLDVQHLILYALMQERAAFKPRWCRLLRPAKVTKVVVIVLEGVSAQDFQSFPDSLPTLKSAFDISAELISPVQYGSTVQEDLLKVPLSISQMKNKGLFDQYNGGLIVDRAESLSYTVEDLGPYSEVNEGCYGDLPESDVFPRTSLLLNTSQMMHEGYPMPVVDSLGKYDSFVFSSDYYAPVGIRSPLLAVDCEMCLTVVGKHEVTRVSIVNEELETVYDTLVKPDNPIKDYLTRYSGITKDLLEPVTTRLEDVQRDLKRILTPDTILCGQSLNGDLVALKVFHPYVIDTSVIYNLSGHRRIKTGLKKLTAYFLGKSIQDSQSGHNSVEDAKATMELVLLKLGKGIHFGDYVNGGPPAIYDSCRSNLTEIKQEDDLQETKDGALGKDSESFSSVRGGEGPPGHVTPAKSSRNEVDFCPNCLIERNVSDTVRMNTVENHRSSVDSNSEQKCQSSERMCLCRTDKTFQMTLDKLCSECIKGSGQNAENTEIASVPSVLCAKCLQKQKNQDMKYKKREKFLKMSQGMKNRNVFFHRGYITHSIMDAIKDVKKTGVVIDEEDSLPMLQNSNQENTLTAVSDRLRMKLARSSLQEKDFIYVTFHGYRNFLLKNVDHEMDPEEEKKHLRKLDKRTWKIFKHVPQKSVFTVVLSGREVAGQVQEARVFAKII
ncbi:hypothetical protein CHS0354_028674 [Potamilus streckersoni]|uniref:Exonuclease domain-containing protein n=1 Tax=Potamilus streckersoni TaxID=2493646 RepID=A0AAE0W337_9BIVA|nr:hypothetical protein CHS0354_028674 [Potamilus streckersoni]